MPTEHDISTEAGFNEQLGELLADAHANGVDVQGAWVVETDDEESPDWDVEIFELVKADR